MASAEHPHGWARAGGRWIAALALGVAVMVPAWRQDALAAPVRNVCARQCARQVRSCLLDAKRAAHTVRPACTGDRRARATCRQRLGRVRRAAVHLCRDDRKACRACCRAEATECARPPAEVPVFRGTYATPERDALAAVSLPPGPDGRGFTLLRLPDGVLFFDPAARTPVSAAAECATVVLACFHPTERNWSGCLAAVPRCRDDTPWDGDGPMCCAAGCGARYQTLRRAGLSGPRAFAAAIWETPSCMPAVAGHVPVGEPE